jgi:hypothetical protein
MRDNEGESKTRREEETEEQGEKQSKKDREK